jgi:hypothetical protein
VTRIDPAQAAHGRGTVQQYTSPLTHLPTTPPTHPHTNDPPWVPTWMIKIRGARSYGT